MLKNKIEPELFIKNEIVNFTENRMKKTRFGIVAFIAFLLTGCQTPPSQSMAVIYTPTDGSGGIVGGTGAESQDIVAVTDEMVRDLLATPSIMNLSHPPRIVIDQAYFKNQSIQPINKDLIVDRLRINLQRATRGRLVFVSREAAGMVAKERNLKRSGATDLGTIGLTKSQAGVDFRLIGKLNSQMKRNQANGTVEQYTQFEFELIDVESAVSVWANMYEMQKAGRDDVIYR